MRKKMSVEKTKLQDRCAHYNRLQTLKPERNQHLIPQTMCEEETPIWPWIRDKGNSGQYTSNCSDDLIFVIMHTMVL